jgi:MoaA/NifB/PqqE/SkfB family radical SAM enzyme
LGNDQKWTTEIDPEGRIIIPPELASLYGLRPGASIRMEASLNEIHIRRPVEHLARLYIEPTNACNLDCRTCMRNVWDEPLGQMSKTVFERILDSLPAFSPLPTVFFGGFGEPLVHPDIIDMVRRVKKLGAPVELITNGILLTEDRALGLKDAGLDILWVSMDGATPESYADVRLGAALPKVIENIKRLYLIRRSGSTPEIGIAFVAMKRNIADLPQILRMGSRLGVSRFSITNVLAHTPELRQETLYKRVMDQYDDLPSVYHPSVSLPRIDLNTITQGSLSKVMGGNYRFILAGHEIDQSIERCPFVDKGSASIRWDGALSPCLSLLHSHVSYLNDRQRHIKAYSFGNILERDLSSLWDDPSYISLRRKLQEFNFSPCVICNACELADDNLADCFFNSAPTCGGCLWAQGLIQCP